MRFHFDERKSSRLRANPKRGVGFEKCRRFPPTQYYLTTARIVPSSTERSAGWKNGCTLLFFEVRKDEEGEYYHLVTLWKATRQEQELYEEHA